MQSYERHVLLNITLETKLKGLTKGLSHWLLPSLKAATILALFVPRLNLVAIIPTTAI